jgi:hypothetical protein
MIILLQDLSSHTDAQGGVKTLASFRSSQHPQFRPQLVIVDDTKPMAGVVGSVPRHVLKGRQRHGRRFELVKLRGSDQGLNSVLSTIPSGP